MEVFAERRGRVLQAIDGVAIVAAAAVAIRNNDVEHEYRQDSDLYYLTGFEEPGAVLLMTTVHGEHRTVMFVRPRDPEREVWDGERAGVDGAKERCGVDAVFPIAELAGKLGEYLQGAERLYYEIGKWPALDAKVRAAITKVRARGRSKKAWPRHIVHPETVWHELRLFKDEGELATMRRAAELTAEAHILAMEQGVAGVHEHTIDALMREHWRRNGCDRVAYAPIVGSGPNATVLHYRAAHRRFEEGELVLIDAGCEYRYYAADVTRTFPVSGRFSRPQRDIYQLVLAAQLAGLERCRPGSNIEAIHQAIVDTVVDGLCDLGLLRGSREEIMKEEKYKRFAMHRSSHWLGMDVHDVGAYFVDGEPRPLAPGMVFTVEPGVYIAAAVEEAPAEYRGIGVRIEDDILITAAGHDNLTAAVPKTIDAVEAACRR